MSTSETEPKKEETASQEAVSINRYRFMQPVDDYRPAKWPIPWPYWCSGSTFKGEDETINIMIAYGPSKEYILEYWPEAYEIDEHETDTVVMFSGRFPKPGWYKGPAVEQIPASQVQDEEKVIDESQGILPEVLRSIA